MITLLAALLLSLPSFAHSTGMTGQSTTGCGSCHGATAAATTTAVLSATSTTLAPGARTNVTLRVRTTSSTRTHAGLDVSATGGTLGAGTNTIKSGSEVTHSAPQALTAGTVNFRFTWRAPSTPGTYTLYAAGNAVNNNGASSGDGWRLATPLTMTVASGVTAPDGLVDEGSEGEGGPDEALLEEALTPEEFFALWQRSVDEAAQDGLGELEDGEAEMDDAALDEGAEAGAGCSAALSGASMGLSALGRLPLVLRRRRATA